MSPPGQKQRGGPAAGTEAEAVVVAANAFLLLRYSTSLMGGPPRREPSPQDHLWVVPIVLTSPGYGAVGEVGSVTVNARTGRVEGGTPQDEVQAAMKRLTGENEGALDAAFRQARAG